MSPAPRRWNPPGPAEIAFVGNRKAAAQADQSHAGCLLVPANFPPVEQ